MESSDDEDGKPAALPNISAGLTTTNDNTSTTVNGAATAHITDGTGFGVMTPVQEQQETTSGTCVQQKVPGELAFLVTHWLSGYNRAADTAVNDTNEVTEQQQQHQQRQEDALKTIHKAAADLAGAFSTLGVFGKKNKQGGGSPKNNSFADMKRTWASSSHCPTEHLQHILQASLSTNVTVDRSVQQNAPENHIQAADEILRASLQTPAEGRTLQEAIVIAEDNASSSSPSHNNDTAAAHLSAASALQAPILLLDQNDDEDKDEDEDGDQDASKDHSQALMVAAPSKSGDNMLVLRASSAKVLSNNKAASSMRLYLDLRSKCENQQAQIRSLQRSVAFQRRELQQLEQERKSLIAHEQDRNSAVAAAAPVQQEQHGDTHNNNHFLNRLDEIKSEQQNCERVIAQLEERQLPGLQRTHAADSQLLMQLRRNAMADFAKVKTVIQNYRDPVLPRPSTTTTYLNNRVLMNVVYRRPLGTLTTGRRSSNSMQYNSKETVRSMLYHRFSHAATINTHLSYPVYCLRFDRTGRYFITGADDYLVKVFCLGGNINTSVVVQKNHHQLTTTARLDPASYTRGAVLVCTLKGHAGVVNDICVSSDNSFLATASEDGDCRVWGLKDGCPVAILRGHTGGANMVSWSTLSPYQLVTTGADGLARTWDVREACLKRYGHMIGSRPEYRLLVNGKNVSSGVVFGSVGGGEDAAAGPAVQGDAVSIPPLPVRENSNDTENVDFAAPPQPPPLPAIPAPPLPPPPAGDVPDPAAENANNNNGDGLFVANDVIDEGVKLISKLQHGATLEERLGGPGTRARRSAVKVICVARCPHGGHFATGSDDGICRVWLEEDNSAVEAVDAHFSPSSLSAHTRPVHRTRAARHVVVDRLLFTLKGHLSAITDLQYSHEGDRILTASQKDGVVRLWSWSSDPCSDLSTPQVSSSTQSRDSAGRNISHILIKLTNPNSTSLNTGRQGSRSRPTRGQATTTSCDVAVWVNDDTKIVTSQSELAKQNGSDIVPGSQYLFLWDSANGHCLLGISGAHTMMCPVVLPHPVDSSIICSAGADGVAKLWNWETGECIFSHTNTADFGPIEASERGKSFGYLDGDFSPDGSSLVLTDDSGRVTVFDSNLSKKKKGSRGAQDSMLVAFPDWMTEQYFSNDYYDLYYDSNGYCVERGSEQPPHLAPKGSRCSHAGVPAPALVNETFKGLIGPTPTCEKAARWHRQTLRDKADRMRQSPHVVGRGNLVRQYDPKTTKLITKMTAFLKPAARTSVSETPQTDRSQNTVSGSNRRLSSNWRWRDYSDIVDGGEDDQDLDRESDDEEFELNESRHRNGARRSGRMEDSESEDLDDDNLVVDSLVPSRQSSRRSHVADVEEYDSGDEFIEYMSTNNTPSGPFVADYELHFFKMPNRDQATVVEGLWTHRNESTSSYAGRKKYTPQIGDSVVYIPRAHYDTINQFPSLQAPWQNWPAEVAWPVVRCCIRNIRYRFPYKDYFERGAHTSIVAKLTLEVTGIPELSSDRVFGWPSPTFYAPTNSHVFEASMFENYQSEFVVPLDLYVSRLTQLEGALRSSDHGVQVEIFYAEDDAPEDAEFIPFKGRVERYDDNNLEISGPNLSGSGYRSVAIVWENDTTGIADLVSPWEVSVLEPKKYAVTPPRPRLDEDEKKRVRDALISIKAIPGVDEYFLLPVGGAYSDYPSRVEVPMNLTFITNRLEADYYSTRYSVVADVRLIYSNCVKYNGENDELSAMALEMLAMFEDRILSEDERVTFHEHDLPLGLDSRATVEEQTNPSGGAVAIRRRSQRQIQTRRSALEDLPVPHESFDSQTRQTRQRTRSSGARQSSRQARSARGEGRSVLESSGIRTLEQLSLNGRQGSRGRVTQGGGRRLSARQQNARQAAPQVPMPRRSARPGLRNSVYGEAPSDIEDEQEPPSRARQVAHEVGDSRRIRISTRHAEVNGGNVASPQYEPELEGRTSRRRQAASTLTHSSRHSGSDSSGGDSEEGGSPTPLQHRATRMSLRSSIQSNDSPVSEVYGNRRSHAQVSRSADDMSSDSTGMEDRKPAFKTRRTTRSRRSVCRDDSSADQQLSGQESEFDEPLEVESSDPEDITISTRASRVRPAARNGKQNESPNRKSTRKRERSDSESSFRAAHNRSAEAPSSYLDPSSSEFGTDVSDAEDLSPPTPTQYKATRRPKKKPKVKKRKAKSTNKSSKKRKVYVDELMKTYGVSKWPEIAVGHVTNVCKLLLERLREQDRLDLFNVPVAEAYPDAADDYLAAISFPMDFRTIEEERLLVYRSIGDLQEDLILVFGNCMNYNEQDSPFAVAASTLLNGLEKMYRDVCEDLNIRFRRHA